MNIVPKLSVYLNDYDFDEKLLLCSLELFNLLVPDLKLKIIDYLYDYECNIMGKLKAILTTTGVPGTYYSQRVIKMK